MSEQAAHAEDDAFVACAWLGLVVSVLVLLPSFAPGYDLFIDEYYYLACARRLAFGYVDHPPLAPLLLRASLAVLRSPLLALRIPPALAFGATVVVAGRIARGLGGGRYAQLLAALSSAAPPVLLVLAGFYSMNALETLLWAGAFWLLVLLARAEHPPLRLWLAFGVLSGLALQNKHTYVLLLGALLLGMLVTPARRQLKQPGFWLAAALAGLIILPNLLWQQAHGWPSLEFYRNADTIKNNPTPPLKVLTTQLLSGNPLALPVWAAGLYWLLRAERARAFRHLGLIYPLLLALLMLKQSSRPDRVAGCFSLLFAAGGVQLEALLRAAWQRRALLALVVAGTLALAPVSLPILPLSLAGSYARALGAPQIEKGRRAPAPQWIADRLGWRSLVAAVRAVVSQLNQADARHAAIITRHYGAAGALELYAPELTSVYSPHNSYYLWAEPPQDTRTFILVGFPRADLEPLFARLELAAQTRCEQCPELRRVLPIWLARQPRLTVSELWRRLKRFL